MLLPLDLGEAHPDILDEFADIYRLRYGPTWTWHPPRHLYGVEYAWIVKTITKLLGGLNGKQLMDAGGGSSALSAFLALRGAAMTVVDRFPEPPVGQLPDGRVIPPIKAVTEDLLQAVPQQDELDGIVSCSAIEHNPWSNIVQITRNLLLRLKPGAPLIVTVPAGRSHIYYGPGGWPEPYRSMNYLECYLWDHATLHELARAVGDLGVLLDTPILTTGAYQEEWDRLHSEMENHPGSYQAPYLSMGFVFQRTNTMDHRNPAFGPRLIGPAYRTDRFGSLMNQFTLDQVRPGVDGRALANWACHFEQGYTEWVRAWTTNARNFLDVLAWGHDHDFGYGLIAKGTMDDRHITNLERVVQPGGLDPARHVQGKRCLVIGAYCGGEVLLLHALGAARVDALEEVPEYAGACARLADAFGIRQASFAASLYELPEAWTTGQVSDGNLTGLPNLLPNQGCYDLVYCPGVIYHCTDQVAALRIMRDLVVPGGSVFFETGMVAGEERTATYLGASHQGWNWWMCQSPAYLQMMTDVGLQNNRHIETTGGRAWFGGIRGDKDPLTENGCAGFSIPSLLGRTRGYRNQP